MFKNQWFHDRQSVQSPPLECVIDCTDQGDNSEAVEYWVGRLNLEGPAWLIREHLRGYGAWGRAELCDHRENLQRLLWIWCHDIAEELGGRRELRKLDSLPKDAGPLYLMY